MLNYTRSCSNAFVVFLYLCLAASASATPQIVRVDGSIFDSAGIPFTGNKDVQIKAYDASSGGTLLWTSNVYNTTVSTGRFTVNMDAASGSSPSLVTQFGTRTSSQGIYFQIEVDSGAANGTMDSAQIVLPRIRAKGTMFALSSAQADSLRGVTAGAAEMNYLSGVTSTASKINSFTATEASYLSGATSNIQSQISAKLNRSGDTLSGSLRMNSGQFAGSTSTTSNFTCGSTTIDFNNGNIQTITSTLGGATTCTIPVSNFSAGAAYSILLVGPTTAVTVSFSASGDGVTNWKYSPAQGPTTANKDTIFSLMRFGTNGYVNWLPGF